MKFLIDGFEVLVNRQDAWLVRAYAWKVKKNKGLLYLERHTLAGEYEKGKVVRTTVSLHRQIMGFVQGDGKRVDHKNGNGLDNRRSNLRPCTQSQNCQNKIKRKNCHSQYKGVSLHKAIRINKWVAYIWHSKKLHILGYFPTEEQAAIAYNEAAKKHFGEYAKLNELDSPSLANLKEKPNASTRTTRRK